MGARSGSWCALAAAAWLVACAESEPEPAPQSAAVVAEPVAPPAAAAPTYVGTARCTACHEAQAEAWQGSHHDLAMQEATPATALAPFEGETFEDESGAVRFHRVGEALRVTAPSETGEPKDYPVAYLFGVDPLQQVLLDRGNGRLAALHVAWDTRPAAQGGQRWFSLHEDAVVPPGDPLHWTGPAGDWNVQCAACHSTGLDLRYDASADRYDPVFAELDVGCEACHGPGSLHVERAEAGAKEAALVESLAARPSPRTWAWEEGASIASRFPPAHGGDTEIGTCAPCHARRAELAPPVPGAPFLDAHRPALAEPGLYHADGQILDEVYVWGSFLQSRMHGAGVRCSDCHDPHALAIPEPDAVCATCHRPEVFAATGHHRHPEDSAGASCVACHMPERTYMVLDDRRDHSLRIPRPHLSVALGVPNACTTCHDDREPAWAAKAAAEWWGPPPAHWAEEPDPVKRLAQRGLPAFLRATSVSQLRGRIDPPALRALEAAVKAPEALERLGAARAGQGLPPRERWARLGPLLDDPRLAVRVEAVAALAGLPHRTPAERASFERAEADFRAVQAHNADQPSALVELGDFERRLGRPADAERAYRRARELGPWFVPASVNLADLLRMQGRDDEGEPLLQEALAAVGDDVPEAASLFESLGLLRVRQKRHAEAVSFFERGVRVAPEDPRMALLMGLTLEALDRNEEAAPYLSRAAEAGLFAR